jgi:hypothetical protein
VCKLEEVEGVKEVEVVQEVPGSSEVVCKGDFNIIILEFLGGY